MICKFFLISLSLGVVLSAPQFVSFKDGNVGVNFGGYHASAGLGGLLTGNAAHGGLSASAGTPFGQNAAAGLDGSVDGVTGGRAYAGAQANSQVGASSILGGSVGGSGIAGAEAHSYGKSKSVVKTVSTVDQPPAVGLRSDFNTDIIAENNIQKVHPPKKYATSSSHVVNFEKSLVVTGTQTQQQPPAPQPQSQSQDSQSSFYATKSFSFDASHQGLPPLPPPLPLPPLLPHPHHHLHLHKHISYQPQKVAVVEKRKEIVNTHSALPPLPPPPAYASGHSHQVSLQKEIVKTAPVVYETVPSYNSGYNFQKNVNFNGGAVAPWLDIPIGILQTISRNLEGAGNINLSKQVSVSKQAGFF